MASYDMANRKGLSKYHYLHHCIRDDIRSGALAAGNRLPSKRAMALDLDVSVNTVERAYAQLVSEGYLEARPGSGFVVRAGMRDAVFAKPSFEEDEYADTSALDLRANRCSLELFPFDTWARMMRQVLSEHDTALLETVPFNGMLPLRRAISAYLYESKGIRVSPSLIVIGAGTEYLYGRLLQLLGLHRIIAIEDPGYKKFADVSRSYGTLWEYIPLDEQGASVTALENGRADTVHVSPANHFPSGTVMSQTRREELLAWVNKEPGRYIIEDDYDSEIRHEGHALPPLITQDKSGRVIYLNTFSKTMVPSIRISYMILPEQLMTLYRQHLSFYSCSVSSFEQIALAKFISEGYFERHINRMQRYYRGRRQFVLDAFAESKISSIAEVVGGQMGTHLLFHIRTGKSDLEVKQMAAERGVSIAMLSDYCARPSAQTANSIVMNFAAVSDMNMRKVMAVLEDIFASDIAAFEGSAQPGA